MVQAKQSPLLDIPRELLLTLYDLLEIKDRIKLNMALPRCSVINTTSCTSKENDAKLAIVYRLFKTNNVVLSSAMTAFLYTNRRDPTVMILIQGSEALQKVQWKPTPSRQINQIKQEQTDAGSIIWADVGETDAECVVQALVLSGTPNVFNSCMSSDNFVRTHILKLSGMFVFALVNYGNQRGLLAHVLTLPDPNECGFPVRSAREYLSRLTTMNIFRDSPKKLQAIINHVQCDQWVLNSVLQRAACDLHMTTVAMLLASGAVF